MGLIMAAVGGYVFGVIAYFLVPIVVSGFAPERVPTDHYYSTAMGILGRGLAVKRKHGGWRLKKSTFDSKYGKERTSIGGETQHWDDPEALMSRLYGWPFGIAHEKSGTITNPRYAELGEVCSDWSREGSLFYEDSNDNKWANGFVRIADRDDRLVNIDHALALMSGDAEPGTTEWSEEITKKSQNPFKSGNFVDYMGGIVAFGATFGAAWLAHQVLSSSGGGRTAVVGMLDLGVALV